MNRPKRPYDLNKRAKLIVDIATDEVDDNDPDQSNDTSSAVKDQAADRQE